MSSMSIYLKIKLAKGGLIKGTATATGHENDILVDSINWGEENSANIGGKGGSVTLRNFEITKRMCPASVQLLLACAGSDTVQEAVIGFRATNVTENVDFLKWTLTDGIISSYDIEASNKEGGTLGERIRIRFATLAVEFRPRGPDSKLGGAVSARLDVGANVSSS